MVRAINEIASKHNVTIALSVMLGMDAIQRRITDARDHDEMERVEQAFATFLPWLLTLAGRSPVNMVWER